VVGDLLISFDDVDAFCINRANIKERNHQVAQMGNIYSQTSRVIA
jgi:hypothetical protein